MTQKYQSPHTQNKTKTAKNGNFLAAFLAIFHHVLQIHADNQRIAHNIFSLHHSETYLSAPET